MHKYCRIAFQNSGGAFVNSMSSDDAWADLLTRCASLKVIFIDEIETCDIELLAQVEQKQIACSARHDMFARQGGDSQNAKRPWGGVNVVMTGDWWQLTPTGDVAVMSNPVMHQRNHSREQFLRRARMETRSASHGIIKKHTIRT